MQLFEIRTDKDFISIQDAEGLGRRLEPLVAYLGPRLGRELEDRYVELVRPPTRLLEAPGTSEATSEHGSRTTGGAMEGEGRFAELSARRDEERDEEVRKLSRDRDARYAESLMEQRWVERLRPRVKRPRSWAALVSPRAFRRLLPVRRK
jgi:hypothetical protein